VVTAVPVAAADDGAADGAADDADADGVGVLEAVGEPLELHAARRRAAAATAAASRPLSRVVRAILGIIVPFSQSVACYRIPGF
jgi:hypothetical protein